MLTSALTKDHEKHVKRARKQGFQPMSFREYVSLTQQIHTTKAPHGTAKAK